MKANMKRMAGAGALAVAMLANMSLAAFAAEPEADKTENLMASELTSASIVTVTQTDAEGSAAGSKDLTIMFKNDEETGDLMMSEDNGATWTKVEMEALQAADLKYETEEGAQSDAVSITVTAVAAKSAVEQ